MKITQLETIRLGEFPNIIWVRLHTDEGLTGLGETFMGAAAVEAYLHEWAAPKLLGQDPLAIESRNRDITGYLGWRGSGVETRGNSAIDIALWDIFGKAANMPVHTALGGKSRDSIRIYNTCAGYRGDIHIPQCLERFSWTITIFEHSRQIHGFHGVEPLSRRSLTDPLGTIDGGFCHDVCPSNHPIFHCAAPLCWRNCDEWIEGLILLPSLFLSVDPV